MADWIPANEDNFNTLAVQFSAAITANPTGYGLTIPDAAALAEVVSNWTSALAAERAGYATWQSLMEDKDTSRTAATTSIRSAGARIQANPNVNDAMRIAAGLPVHKDSRTPAPVPSTAPVLEINAGNRLSHTISWRDSSSPTSKARPAGVAGLELFIKIGGEPPTSIDECRPLGMITRSPNLEEFAPADGGKIAYYIGRWVNTRSDPGPKSETAAATIQAQA